MSARRLAALALVAGCGLASGGEVDECVADADCGPGAVCLGIPCTRDRCGSPRECHPIRGDGEPCERSIGELPYHSNCARGLRCDPETRRCAPGLGEGGECWEAGSCADGFVCDAAVRCRAVGSAGEGGACGHEDVCGPDLTCARSACLPALPAGASCAAAPSACADGFACRDGVCGG